MMLDKPDTDKGDDEGHYVAEHVEGVGHKGHGVGDVTNHELHHHVGGGEDHHVDQLGAWAAPLHAQAVHGQIQTGKWAVLIPSFKIGENSAINIHFL